MGYTHYWYRESELNQESFNNFLADTKKIIKFCQNELSLKLANGNGEGEPFLTADMISFNGSDEQEIGRWTTSEHISIPWPSSVASLIPELIDPIAEKVSGSWFAGSLLSQRVAPIGGNGLGSGSYETVCIERVFEPSEWQKNDPPEDGLYFSCCKTAYRPYDLTTTAVLIALKHHFPTSRISSDGEEKDWLDGMFLCNNLLGYGMDFKIDI